MKDITLEDFFIFVIKSSNNADFTYPFLKRDRISSIISNYNDDFQPEQTFFFDARQYKLERFVFTTFQDYSTALSLLDKARTPNRYFVGSRDILYSLEKQKLKSRLRDKSPERSSKPKPTSPTVNPFEARDDYGS